MSLKQQDNSSIRELVRRVRRRFLLNVAVSQGVLAASVGMGGVILLLVFGAQFLDWRWLASLAILTFPLAYFRTARRIPSAYRVAQIVDARMDLRDSISTALYFSEHAEPGRGSESMRQAQAAESERIGSQIDPKRAIPLARPRMLYVLGSLFMIAALLFGLRYLVQRKMDLSRPLARILIDAFGGGFEQKAELKKAKRFPMDIWNQMAQDDPAGPDSQFKDDDSLKGPASPENAADGALKQPGAEQSDSDQQAGDGEKGSDGSKEKGEGAGQESDEAGSKGGAKDSESSSGSKEGDGAEGKQPPNSSENNSLASKIKDAMSNLLNSMRSKDGPQNSQTPGKSGGDPKSQQGKSGQKASAQGEKKSGDQNSGPEEGQAGDSESGKPGEGKGSSQSADGQPGSNGGNGAGKQDGSKDTKLAQQLAAMGKISEIIGKRSASVTGEVTIEVTSSKQAVRAPSTEGKAAHGEATGEINRDEVPAAFQEYVQQYFEQVRKPSKGTTKGTTPASP